jgi:zinc and cadmium transporter
MQPLEGLTSPAWSATASLAVYLVLIAAAALAGGASVRLLSLGHRPMQVVLSFTGGVLLGVGLLHLLPHACLALGGAIETTAGWMLVGFFAMFLLERAFHGHAHHAAEVEDQGPSSYAGPAHSDSHSPAGHRHGPGCGSSRLASAGRWSWCGAFIGLALHSLSDGAALAASVRADAAHGGGSLSGFATFLAIALHKPIDSALIATLLVGAGASAALRRSVNLAYALVVPAGAFGFLAALRAVGVAESTVLGVAMALAAGAFVCIAAADLLPEVQFHSHDRILLTAALALGLAVAWGITMVERSTHAHSLHAHPRHAPPAGLHPEHGHAH